MTEKNLDWASEAEYASFYTSCELFSIDRAAIPWNPPGITLVFANDDLAEDQRAKDGLADVRSYLAAKGIEELGFATDDNGFSWAMLVRSTDHIALNNVLWEARTFYRREARRDIIRAMIFYPDRSSMNY